MAREKGLRKVGKCGFLFPNHKPAYTITTPESEINVKKKLTASTLYDFSIIIKRYDEQPSCKNVKMR